MKLLSVVLCDLVDRPRSKEKEVVLHESGLGLTLKLFSFFAKLYNSQHVHD